MTERARDRSDSRHERLRADLRRGLGAGEVAANARAELELGAHAEDRDVARALVQIVSAVGVASIRIGTDLRADPRPVEAAHVGDAADASLVGRLGAEGAGGIPIAGVADARTLVATLRGGSPAQRRAAARRILEALQGGVLDAARRNVVAEAITTNRDAEIAPIVARAREHVGGAVAKEAKAERALWARVVEEIRATIRTLWDGENVREPVMALPSEQRALVLLRLAEAPDDVAWHVATLIEDDAGPVDAASRRDLLSLLRYAGDPRLVPALVAVLQSDPEDVVVDAARALARIDDPRVWPALRARFERAVTDVERVVLAGALGLAGDAIGRPVVREMLGRDDPRIVRRALEALRGVGGPEDRDVVTAFLEHPASEVVIQAVRALGRIGDRRSLAAFHELGARTTVSAIRGGIEEAEIAIRARAELRGEDTTSHAIERAAGVAPILASRAPFAARVRAWWDYVVGETWLAFGAIGRAIARLERASARRPGWPRPPLLMAMTFVRRGEHARALAAFRRALEADRAFVERQAVSARELARTFLARAEEVEREGRVDVALGLLGEALSLDLRRVPGAIRFELERRQEALRRESRS